VVPCSWLIVDGETHSYWPPKTKSSVSTKRLVMQDCEFENDWDLLPVKVLHKYSKFYFC